MPKMFFAPLFLLDLAATLYLWGVIWTIQMAQYPLFARIGAASWADYHMVYTRSVTFVVLPAMVTELAASGLLALARPAWLSGLLLWAGLCLRRADLGRDIFCVRPAPRHAFPQL